MSATAPPIVSSAAVTLKRAKRRGRQHGAFAHGGDRRHARGADRRPQRREQRDEDPDDERDDDRPRREHGSGLRQVDPEGDEERIQSLREAEPEEETR